MPQPPTEFGEVLDHWAQNTHALASVSDRSVHGAYFVAPRTPGSWPTANEVAWLYQDKPVLIYHRDGSYTLCPHGMLEDTGLLAGWASHLPRRIGSHLSMGTHQYYYAGPARNYERNWRENYTHPRNSGWSMTLSHEDAGAVWAHSVLTYRKTT